MALETWNGRTASQTDSDSPLDTTLMDGLRKDLDHLRQVLYGSTEPNFHTPIWGHTHDGVDSKTVVLASQTAGDYLLYAAPNISPAINSTSYVKAKEIKVGVAGAFRISFRLSSDPTGTFYGQIYRNGVAVGIERSVTTTVTTFSEDISGWSAGDLIQVYAKVAGGATNRQVSLFHLYTAAPPIAGELLNY